MTPDQRLIGMDLIELRALAFGGDPAGAAQVGQRLSRAAAALEQVSASLERAAGQFGLGWQGRAADAVRTGIAGHAQWARAAAGQAASAAGNASAQAASANFVRSNMPDPGIRSAALGPGDSRVGTNPVGTNLALAEEAQRNARLRAVELLEGHAAKSAAQRPTGVLEAPPGGAVTSRAGPAAGGRAGPAVRTAAGRGAATGARVPGRTAGPVTAAAQGAPAARPFAGPRSGAGPTGTRVDTTGGAPAGVGTPGGGTASASARADAALGRGAPPVPETAGYGPREPLGRAGPGVWTAGPMGTGSPVTYPSRGWTSATRTELSGFGTGHDRPPLPEAPVSRPHRAAVPGVGGGEPPARHGAGVDQVTEQQAGPGPHRSREGAEPAGGMAPPIGGGMTGTASDTAHQRLGFLIDEDCAFDGDPADHGWVTPPVIGA